MRCCCLWPMYDTNDRYTAAYGLLLMINSEFAQGPPVL
jgi:hypothetical protein